MVVVVVVCGFLVVVVVVVCGFLVVVVVVVCGFTVVVCVVVVVCGFGVVCEVDDCGFIVITGADELEDVDEDGLSVFTEEDVAGAGEGDFVVTDDDNV